MKRIYFGKIKKGWHLVPKIDFWGGAMFVGWIKFTVMFVLPDWLIKELAIWGIDAIGD